eukprot:m.81891 g.81891  ORF g.81891 m.81891 type:complete len:72 (+) comp50755_c1_seq1:184-399(+)
MLSLCQFSVRCVGRSSSALHVGFTTQRGKSSRDTGDAKLAESEGEDFDRSTRSASGRLDARQPDFSPPLHC